MTYDGTLLNSKTGLANASEKHPFSAASKEALQIQVYAHAIAGDARAASFVYSQDPEDAAQWAVAMMSTKLQTYLKFNNTYPGFGGFLPWFLSNETAIQPTSDWVNRVPALDNGELIWAVYAAVQALNQSDAIEWRKLAQGWQKWLDYTKENAARVGVPHSLETHLTFTDLLSRTWESLRCSRPQPDGITHLSSSELYL